MKSVIRQWNPDAGTYGDVLLTLFAPEDAIQGAFPSQADAAEFVLWDVVRQVADLMREPVAVFFDDETEPTWTNSAYGRRVA